MLIVAVVSGLVIVPKARAGPDLERSTALGRLEGLPRLLSPGAIGMDWPPWEAQVVYESTFGRFAADLDGDGDEDVVLAGGSPDPIRPRAGVILLNNGDFTFTVANGDRPAGVHPTEMLLADFDGDGSSDLFIADSGDDASNAGWHNKLLLWTPDGYLDATDRLPADPHGYTHKAAVGDIDGDGDLDVLVGNSFEAQISGQVVFGPYFLLNDGRANFTADTERLPDAMKTVFRPWQVDLVDLDGDGHDDLVAGATEEDYEPRGASFVYWGSDDGKYRDDDVTVLPRADFFERLGSGTAHIVGIGVHDCDGDGLPDLLLGGYDADDQKGTRGVQLLVNAGGRTFVDETDYRIGDSASSPTEGWHSQHRFFDFNRDGTVDIVPQGYAGVVDGGPNIMAWLNDGACRYVPLRTTEFDHTSALWHFAWGTIVRVEAEFKAMWFGGDDATHLTAKAAVVVENAEITLVPSPSVERLRLEDLDLKAEGEPFTLDLAGTFGWPAETWTFAVATTDPRVATAIIADGLLTVTGTGAGVVTVAVNATAREGQRLTRFFRVTVRQATRGKWHGWRLELLRKLAEDDPDDS